MKIKYLVFFLFFVGCATTTSIISSDKLKVDMSKEDLRSVFFTSYPGDDPTLPGAGSEYFSNVSKEIIWGKNKKQFYVFKNVSNPMNCGVFLCSLGNGTLDAWFYTLAAARAEVEKNNTSINSSKINKSSNSYDKDKYAICYGKMTKAHKARGFHQRNRSMSIKVKETVCKAYAKGEINNYEGKGL